VVVRDGFHRLLDEFVTFILQALSVSVLSGVDTTAVVVVLRGRGRGSVNSMISFRRRVNSGHRRPGRNLPVAIGGHNIIDLQLLTDFLDSQVEGVRLELFAGHVGDDGSGQAHEAGGLVLVGVTPSVPLLATARSIGLGAWVTVSVQSPCVLGFPWARTRLRAATTLQVVIASIGIAVISGVGVVRFAAESALSQGDVVGSSDALVSPGHLIDFLPVAGR
jgi:hypothetical protein